MLFHWFLIKKYVYLFVQIEFFEMFHLHDRASNHNVNFR